mmetsp:Transcript_5271/g.17111  ORF Transcript_5271/g.17111 Transcript_5271/m.17111 type:complete len:222 (+) Transcript_5271:264-929(+)
MRPRPWCRPQSGCSSSSSPFRRGRFSTQQSPSRHAPPASSRSPTPRSTSAPSSLALPSPSRLFARWLRRTCTAPSALRRPPKAATRLRYCTKRCSLAPTASWRSTAAPWARARHSRLPQSSFSSFGSEAHAWTHPPPLRAPCLPGATPTSSRCIALARHLAPSPQEPCRGEDRGCSTRAAGRASRVPDDVTNLTHVAAHGWRSAQTLLVWEFLANQTLGLH